MSVRGNRLSMLFTIILVGALLLGAPIYAVTEKTLEEIRVTLDEQDAARTGIVIRHKLGNGKVSAHLSYGDKIKIEQLGIPYEIVPVRKINSYGETKARPGKVTRVIPASQVPYGIKMVYGNPELMKDQVAGGSGITIAVLDTGCIDHPDFVRIDGTKVITQKVDFSQTRRPQVEGVAKDGNGHGTHVTGTIAAAGGIDGKGIFGVAPGASIYSYKVLTDKGTGYSDDIARAILIATDRGAQIISMSLGSSLPSTIELEAIRYAVNKGVLVIAAAGNAGPQEDTIGYPGAFSEVVSVASLNPDEVISFYSSRGINDYNDDFISEREVEVSAPGFNILSTYNTGGYAVASGTSMATPHISGLAAKMWQGSAESTRLWLKIRGKDHDILKAEQIDNASLGYDIASGYGLPQIETQSLPKWND